MKKLLNYIKRNWNKPDTSEGSSRVRYNQTYLSLPRVISLLPVEKLEPCYTSKMISQNRFDKLGHESYKQLNEDYLQLVNHYNKTI